MVVPIRGGRAEAARQLVEEGPPFDLEHLGSSGKRGCRRALAKPASAERGRALARHSRRPATARHRAIRLDAPELTNSRQPSSEAETDPAPPARPTRRLAQAKHPRRPLAVDDRQVMDAVLGHHCHCRLDRRVG